MVQDGHREHEDNLPSPEGPIQPPMYRPTTTRAVESLDYHPTTGPASVIERCKAGTTPVYPSNSEKTGTTALNTGTTATPFREHLQEPTHELPMVQPPPMTGTTALPVRSESCFTPCIPNLPLGLYIFVP